MVIYLKKAKVTVMPFGSWAKESCISWGPDAPWEGAILRGKGKGHARGHSAVSFPKMAEPIDLPFGLWTRVGLKEAQVQSYSPDGANVPSWEGTLAPPGEYD